MVEPAFCAHAGDVNDTATNAVKIQRERDMCLNESRVTVLIGFSSASSTRPA
jgi:hypothetical protein